MVSGRGGCNRSIQLFVECVEWEEAGKGAITDLRWQSMVSVGAEAIGVNF